MDLLVDGEVSLCGGCGHVELLRDEFELVHEHHGLDELHVAELGVPVDVRGAHQQRRSVLLRDPVVPRVKPGLQQRGQTNVVCNTFSFAVSLKKLIMSSFHGNQ
jgi:hypothetical protein